MLTRNDDAFSIFYLNLVIDLPPDINYVLLMLQYPNQVTFGFITRFYSLISILPQHISFLSLLARPLNYSSMIQVDLFVNFRADPLNFFEFRVRTAQVTEPAW